jgi:hypothetical protein
MKNPQRGQSILHCRDSSRLEHTGQNWFGNSGAGPGLAGCDAPSLICPYPLWKAVGLLAPGGQVIPQA